MIQGLFLPSYPKCFYTSLAFLDILLGVHMKLYPSRDGPITALYQHGDSSFTERVVVKEGKMVRVQTETRNGLVFMRAKQRIMYQAHDETEAN